MPLYGIQLAAWVFQTLFRKMSLLVLLLFSSPTSSSPSFYLSPLLSPSFFLFFSHSISALSTNISCQSRSQARSLMELFRRTISRAGSAFFIEHWPFELPWNSPRRIVTRELIQRKSLSGLALVAGNVSNIRWTVTRPLQNPVHCFWSARFHDTFAFRVVTFKCTRKSSAGWCAGKNRIKRKI